MNDTLSSSLPPEEKKKVKEKQQKKEPDEIIYIDGKYFGVFYRHIERCKRDGCSSPMRRNGLCYKHYNEQKCNLCTKKCYREYSLCKEHYKASIRGCSYVGEHGMGCDSSEIFNIAKLLCKKHYYRTLRLDRLKNTNR